MRAAWPRCPLSYRRAMSEEVALAELDAGAGSQFDPDVVAAFFSAREQHEPTAAEQPAERGRLA
jgi:HD-GYP domain-containing protein (c-di-GMP phosphodiesterase class II)